jgi:hypothetical protein
MGVPTGDGRILDPAGGSSRSLPLPLMYQGVTGEGHDGARVVARIESLTFRDGMVLGEGSMLDSEEYSEVVEQLEAGVIGPSVDLDDIDYVMDDAGILILTRWRVAGATLVAVPAFADVGITLDPRPAETAYDTPETVLEYESLYASATAVLPPAEWFSRPDVDRLTPLTVTDAGRVFGHIAPWGECHVGLPGCVTAPSSVSGYAYFHVGEQRTACGGAVPVGTLVAGPRHADPALAFQAATQHYDDPSAAVAKVIAGEDEHGIWVAGWMLPGAAPEAVEVFRSSPVSGDWRRVGGSLELIGVCSVNSPGFPVPRAKVSFSLASGGQRSLVASFGITPVTGEAPVAGPKPPPAAVARARWAWFDKAGEG